MYVVVCTVVDGLTKVQAVPTSFFSKYESNKIKYFYPKRSKHVREAIRKQSIPDDKDWYEIVDYEIISGEIGKEFVYYTYIMVLNVYLKTNIFYSIIHSSFKERT